MTDSAQRKVPPDRPPAEGNDDRKKKTKLDDVPLAIMDDNMPDHEGEEAAEQSISSDMKESKNDKDESTQKFISYRATLMGFNGVAHCDHVMEEDDLFSDDKEITWKLPEESEEIKKLKELYPVAPCTQEEYNEWCEPWNYALILTVLGKRFNLYVLKDLLKNMWGFSSFEIIDLPNNYFVLRFQDPELWRAHYRKVLYDGPWVIQQHCVLVQRWSPYFNPHQNALGRVATWVRIPDIPIHCYNKHFISRLGDRIGRTLKVDMNTLNDLQASTPKIERGKFIRICVELNLQKKLVPKVIAAGSIFNVEYEGLHLICFSCGRFGHRKEVCPYKLHSTDVQGGTGLASQPDRSTQVQLDRSTPAKPPVNPPANLAEDDDEPFGPWMLISRRSRFPKRPELPDHRDGRTRGRSARDAHFGQKSAFSVLDDFKEEGYLPSEDKVVMGAVNRAEFTRTDNGQMTHGKKRVNNPAGNFKNQKRDFRVNGSGPSSKVQYKIKGIGSGSNPSGPNSELGSVLSLAKLKNHVVMCDGPPLCDGPGIQNEQLVLHKSASNLQAGPTLCGGPESQNGQIVLYKSTSNLQPGPSNTTNKDKGSNKSSSKQAKGQRTHMVVQGNISTLGNKDESSQARVHDAPQIPQSLNASVKLLTSSLACETDPMVGGDEVVGGSEGGAVHDSRSHG